MSRRSKKYEKAIRTKKSNIHISLQQGKEFKCFKEKEKFIQIVRKFGVNKPTIIFEINVLKLIDKYPRLMLS